MAIAGIMLGSASARIVPLGGKAAAVEQQQGRLVGQAAQVDARRARAVCGRILRAATAAFVRPEVDDLGQGAGDVARGRRTAADNLFATELDGGRGGGRDAADARPRNDDFVFGLFLFGRGRRRVGLCHRLAGGHQCGQCCTGE
ncbi:hypothetical protein LRS08_17350 [Sphingomonas sp. J315]|nr:hypothetical protein [Sphingomonas sp. J315]UUX99219.1 hypothetical protein LRS08_17350 [Sphingomonas sp. J315]